MLGNFKSTFYIYNYVGGYANSGGKFAQQISEHGSVSVSQNAKKSSQKRGVIYGRFSSIW